MLSYNQRVHKKEMLKELYDLSKLPEHLQKKWWRENWTLFDYSGKPIWPVGRPDNLPYKVICALYWELVFWTCEPVGIYNPENLGKIDLDYPSEYDS